MRGCTWEAYNALKAPNESLQNDRQVEAACPTRMHMPSPCVIWFSRLMKPRYSVLPTDGRPSFHVLHDVGRLTVELLCPSNANLGAFGKIDWEQPSLRPPCQSIQVLLKSFGLLLTEQYAYFDVICIGEAW